MPVGLHNRGALYPDRVYASVGGNSTRGVSFLLSLRHVDRPTQQEKLVSFIPFFFLAVIANSIQQTPRRHHDLCFCFLAPSSKGGSLV